MSQVFSRQSLHANLHQVDHLIQDFVLTAQLHQILELFREVGEGLVQANPLLQLRADGSFEDFQVGVLVLGIFELCANRGH